MAVYRSPIAGALSLIVNLIFGIIELIIALRIILELFGANAASGFVSWIYSISDSLIAPFLGIFPNFVYQGRFVIDTSAIFALVVYGIIGLLIARIIYWIFPVREVEE